MHKRSLSIFVSAGILLAFLMAAALHQGAEAKTCYNGQHQVVPCPNYQNPTQPPPPTKTPTPQPADTPNRNLILQPAPTIPWDVTPFNGLTPVGAEPEFGGGGPSSRAIGAGLAVLLCVALLIGLSKRLQGQKAKGSSETDVVASVLAPLRIAPSSRRHGFDGDLDPNDNQGKDNPEQLSTGDGASKSDPDST